MDLTEARDIAESGDMALFICDYHRESGQLCTAEGKEREAREHLEIEKEMREKMREKIKY